MKTFLKTYIFPLLLMLLGTAAAIGILSGRVVREQDTRSYDMVLDYTTLKELAEESGESVDIWLSRFQALGVTKLGVEETSAAKLAEQQNGVFFLEDPLAIRSSFGWEARFPEDIAARIRDAKKGDMLGICTDRDLLNWVLTSYAQRCDIPVNATILEDGTGFFLLSSDESHIDGQLLATLPLGVLPEEQALAEAQGFTVIPRTLPVKYLNGKTFAEGVMADYREQNVPYLLGGGAGVIGYEDMEEVLPELLDFLKNENITLGVVETSQQSLNLDWDGLQELVEASGYDAIRVFTMWDYIQSRSGWYGYEGPEEVTNCLYRAVYERDCRILYLKPLTDEESGEYITDPAAYETLLTDLTERMAARDYQLETLTPADNYTISFALLLLVAFGAIGAAVLLLDCVVPLKKKWRYGLLLLGCVCAAGVLFVAPNTGRLVLSIGGGIVLPTLALVLLTQKYDVPQALLGVFLLSLVGAVYASAPLSDSAYMLEMKLYRGVKVLQLLPIALFVVYFLKTIWGSTIGKALNTPGLPASVKGFLGRPLKQVLLGVVILAAAVLVAVLVGTYYIDRTGHSAGAEVSVLEMLLRNFMENVLIARPRTKEFLIGWPCVLLFAWSMKKQLHGLSLVLGIGAAIGVTSVVNTFLHIHTPFLLSLARTGIGLGFGLVVGVIVVLLAEVLYRFIGKRVGHV